MDARDLVARLAEARRATLRIGKMSFRVVMPTEHAMRVAFERHRNRDGVVMEALAARELLDAAIEGWENVPASVVLPEAGDEPLPFGPAALSALLDNRQDLADQLAVLLAAERKARREHLEAARKN